MQSITFALLAAVFAHSAVANESPSPTVGPTETPPSTCETFTTAGPTCPVYSCARPACLKLSTLTQSCGCASIYTTFACTNPCTDDCLGTSYITVADPACPTSPPDSPSYPTSETSSPSDTVTITSDYSTTTPPPEVITSPTRYGNSTITSTSVTIITITSCPASVTCTGQTTTWESTNGPFPCSTTSTCTCVLPGGTSETVTGGPATNEGNTPPQPTSSFIPAGAGNSVTVGGGILAGLLAAAVGML